MKELQNELQKQKEMNTEVQSTWTEEYGLQLEKKLAENLTAINKRKDATEEEYMSALILYLQQKDINEFKSTDKKKKKSYHLARFLKNEMIVRSAKNGCKNTSFNLSTQAAKAVLGVSFLIEDGSLSYYIKPLDRQTHQLIFKLNESNLSNAQIYYYNTEYNLNIPKHEEKEIMPDEEQIADNNFTATNVLKIIR